MIFLGIDPGKNGAIAILDSDGMHLEIHDMPGTTTGLHDVIAALPLVNIATIESPIFPHHIGIKTVVKIAMAYGALVNSLAWRSIPVDEVRPDQWKKSVGVTTDKDTSREKASRLFPDAAGRFKRKKDDGRAEAALLAWHGMSKHARTRS